MKKTLLLFLCLVMVFTSVQCAAQEENSKFTVISLDCPEGEKYINEDYQKYAAMLLRYKDTKESIPMSVYYDGLMYGTVPVENKDREVEMYISVPLSFSDNRDDDETDINMYSMTELSRLGIIKGDENNMANPNSKITRAEATAMIMRLIGVDNSGPANSGFEDVDENAWYGKTVARAKDYGIIQGDSDKKFSPDRNVTREEISMMTARAMWVTGHQREDKNTTTDQLREIYTAEDINDISKGALSAYKTMRTFNITDYVYDENQSDSEFNDKNFYYPKKAAKRCEVASIISSAREMLQVYPSKIAVEYGFDKGMPVIDGSTSTYPFTEAVYNALFYSGYNHPDKPAKHSKSHKTYERLINGEIDAMIASVYPAQDILDLAEEKGVELELIPIAYDAMVFFTNASNPADGLTIQQITDIYVDNKYSNWKDLGGVDSALYPYARNYDSGSHAQMEKHFLKGKDINEKIRQETTSISMANVLTDVMDAETKEPLGFGLGYSIYYYFNNMDLFYDTATNLKLLKIDGVYPTDETIADKSYPLSNNTYVVIRKDSAQDSKARRFAKFMLTPSGQECVKLAGFGPLENN